MIPTPYTLAVKRYTTSTTDGHGNAVDGYAAAVDWHVHAVAPGAMVENTTENRDVSSIAYTIIAPVSDETPSERDLVTVDGADYEVNGRPSNWSRGPWTFPDAGVTVELRRVEG